MQITKEDEKVIKTLAKVGCLTRKQLLKLGYTKGRIQNRYANSNKEYNLLRRIGKECTTKDEIFKLTDIGYALASKLLKVHKDFLYRGQGRKKTMNFKHDMKLAEIYLSLTEEEQETWITEDQIKKLIKDVRADIRTKDIYRYTKELDEVEMSALDGGYIDKDNNMCYVEVITKYYKKEKIKQKEEAIKMLLEDDKYYFVYYV